jgi:hypothetical protein
MTQPPLLAVMQGGDYHTRFQFLHTFYVATYVSVDLPRLRNHLGEKPASAFGVSVDLVHGRHQSHPPECAQQMIEATVENSCWAKALTAHRFCHGLLPLVVVWSFGGV